MLFMTKTINVANAMANDSVSYVVIGTTPFSQEWSTVPNSL